MTTETQPTKMPVKDLTFDRQNPRLAEFNLRKNPTDEDIIKVLWKAMDVMELVQSIAASGFFSHEQIIVAKEGGRNVVIEGNRRLAAVRVLLDPKLVGERAKDIPDISEPATLALQNLPVLEETRDKAWQYLGFKHVNGPAKWSSYAKAKYISYVHKTLEIPLEQIATQIGDGHNTVQRLFRGLMVLEQAEAAGVFDRDDRTRTRLSFSHLYTGLDYDGIADYISVKRLDEETRSPVPDTKIAELGELCVWLYGSKREQVIPVVQSQNPHLRQLNDVLKSRDATEVLRSTRDLASAVEAARPPQAVFEQSLLAAKRNLKVAMAYLTDGYDGSEDTLLTANSVANLADNICASMKRKSSFSTKQPRPE